MKRRVLIALLPVAWLGAAYGQGAQYRCPLCYGTQLIAAAPAQVPGVRAILVRPSILTDTGTLLAVLLPVPSWPEELSPHAARVPSEHKAST